MDQLTYRSGKWDIINVTLSNNILIYCAAQPRLLTELRLRSALEAAIVNTMTLVCPNLSPIPSLMDLLAFMIAFILLRFGHTGIAFSGQSIFQSNEECNCFQT